MLWSIFLTLMVLWLIGLVTSVTFNGFIHIFLLAALAMMLLPVIQRRIKIA